MWQTPVATMRTSTSFERGRFVPRAYETELEECRSATVLPDVPVAVRSSATAEDLPSASFAGQQDTYLNVRGLEDLLTAVRDCWASLWTARAMAYRARQGIDPASVSLAVVVQQMVEAEAAGVMFTANPANGRRDDRWEEQLDQHHGVSSRKGRVSGVCALGAPWPLVGPPPVPPRLMPAHPHDERCRPPLC